VRFVVTDRETYQPVRTALLFIDLVRRMHPAHFRWQERGAGLDRLAGTGRLRAAIEEHRLRRLLAAWDRDADAFAATRKRYLLY
jgi:uncharacterized protein YbbC (DUF1343 family)